MYASLKRLFEIKIVKNLPIEDELKLAMAYRMTMFLTIGVGLTFVILGFFLPIGVTAFTLFSFITLIFATYYIRKTNQYKIQTLLINIAGAISCTSTLFLVHSQPHFVDAFWISINILFVFLVLGPKWGIFFSIYHTISMGLYYLLIFSYQMTQIKEITNEMTIGAVINVSLCFLIIGYLSWENIRTSKIIVKRLNDAQDVLKLQYEIISKQNTEKTVMLKEIHHRVKNNLQIITSLLRLQSRELENPEAIAKFKDATHRVIAMSMIHEKMYQSDELSTLSFKEYLQDLSNDLLISYQSGYNVKLKIECNIDSIGLKAVVPIALILNELISNSLKYAFDDNDNCEIQIDFQRLNDKKFKLIYKDSGTWKEPTRQGSFGMDLIESLTYQMEGSMELKTYPVTIFNITFSPQED